MANALLKRINRLRDHIHDPGEQMVIIVVNYGENAEKIIKEKRGSAGKYTLIINPWGKDNIQPSEDYIQDDIDLKIEKEIKELKSYGYTLREIEEIIGSEKDAAPAGQRKAKGSGTRTERKPKQRAKRASRKKARRATG